MAIWNNFAFPNLASFSAAAGIGPPLNFEKPVCPSVLESEAMNVAVSIQPFVIGLRCGFSLEAQKVKSCMLGSFCTT